MKSAAMEKGTQIHMELMKSLTGRMPARVTVQRAYLKTIDGKLTRSFVDSTGRVLIPATRKWYGPVNPCAVIKLKGVYERWCDLPRSWLGFIPFFS